MSHPTLLRSFRLSADDIYHTLIDADLGRVFEKVFDRHTVTKDIWDAQIRPYFVAFFDERSIYDIPARRYVKEVEADLKEFEKNSAPITISHRLVHPGCVWDELRNRRHHIICTYCDHWVPESDNWELHARTFKSDDYFEGDDWLPAPYYRLCSKHKKSCNAVISNMKGQNMVDRWGGIDTAELEVLLGIRVLKREALSKTRERRLT